VTTIGVFGPAGDAEVQAVARRLRHRGVKAWVIDLSLFPTHANLSLSGSGVTFQGRSLAEIDGAYLRRVGAALPEVWQYDGPPCRSERDGWPALREVSRSALQREQGAYALRLAALRWLAQRRPVINPPVEQNLHRLKLSMMTRLSQAGLPVPPFAGGSARGALFEWVNELRRRGQEAVSKPPAGIYKTFLADDQRLEAHPWVVRPAFLQRYVPGDTVRCFVIRGQLLSAARIVHGGTIDSSMSQTGIEVVSLNEAGRQAAEGTARALDLDFCGLDLMIDGSGQPWVIDCNLSPMFVNYGRLSRCDVAGVLADRLIERARGEGPAESNQALQLLNMAKELLAGDPDLASAPRTQSRRTGCSRTSNNNDEQGTKGHPLTGWRVGLWGSRRDPHVAALGVALKRRGAGVEHFDFSVFPGLNQVSFGSPGTWSFDDILADSPRLLRQMDVLYRRSTPGTELTPEAAAQLSASAVADHYRRQIVAGAFQGALLASLARHLPVVNPPQAHQCHRLKTWQHHLLRRAGIPTPSTVVTNDLEVVRAFVSRWQGRVVVKPQTSGAEVVRVDDALLTRRHRESIRRPQMYQQLVQGRSFRLYALGGRIVALGELFFDRQYLDWRERPKRVTLCEPDQELTQQVARATKLLNLPFCGIDVEYDDATAQRYLLDFNPGAYFVEAGRMMQLDLADEVAKYLGEVARRRTCWW
jgi:glutathione synthase/RimK-type ligase-like ATP-grasp enzyme